MISVEEKLPTAKLTCNTLYIQPNLSDLYDKLVTLLMLLADKKENIAHLMGLKKDKIKTLGKLLSLKPVDPAVIFCGTSEAISRLK